jgi:hypothetical protein
MALLNTLHLRGCIIQLTGALGRRQRSLVRSISAGAACSALIAVRNTFNTEADRQLVSCEYVPFDARQCPSCRTGQAAKPSQATSGTESTPPRPGCRVADRLLVCLPFQVPSSSSLRRLVNGTTVALRQRQDRRPVTGHAGRPSCGRTPTLARRTLSCSGDRARTRGA